jgi:hypothetical protein
VASLNRRSLPHKSINLDLDAITRGKMLVIQNASGMSANELVSDLIRKYALEYVYLTLRLPVDLAVKGQVLAEKFGYGSLQAWIENVITSGIQEQIQMIDEREGTKLGAP